MNRKELIVELDKLQYYLDHFSIDERLAYEIRHYVSSLKGNVANITSEKTYNNNMEKARAYVKALAEIYGEIKIEIRVDHKAIEKSLKDIEKALHVINSVKYIYPETLSNELSICDKKLVDIEHYIEFNKKPLKGRGTVYIYNEIHNVRRNRRAIKDYIEVIKRLTPLLPGIESTLNLYAERRYTPYVYEELFKEDDKPCIDI